MTGFQRRWQRRRMYRSEAENKKRSSRPVYVDASTRRMGSMWKGGEIQDRFSVAYRLGDV